MLVLRIRERKVRRQNRRCRAYRAELLQIVRQRISRWTENRASENRLERLNLLIRMRLQNMGRSLLGTAWQGYGTTLNKADSDSLTHGVNVYTSTPDMGTFTDDERNAAEKLGELFGTGWLEIDSGKAISFPNPFQKEEGPVGSSQQALVNQ